MILVFVIYILSLGFNIDSIWNISRKKTTSFSGFEALGVWLIIGLIFSYLIEFNLSRFGIKTPIWELLGFTLFLTMVLIFLQRKSLTQMIWVKNRLSKTECFLLFLCAIGVLFYFSINFTKPLTNWDSIASWALKAKFFYNDTLATTDMFNRSNMAYMQFEYPLLIPFSIKTMYSLVGEVDEMAANRIFPFVYLAGVFLIYSFVRLFSKRLFSLFFVVLFVYMPHGILMESFREAADGYQAIFFLAAAGFLFKFFYEDDLEKIFYFAFFSGGVPLIKNEGMSLALILWLSFALIVLIKKNKLEILKSSFLPLMIFIAIFLNWYFYFKTLPNMTTKYPDLITISNLVNNIEKVPEILKTMIYYWSKFSQYSLFWVAYLILLLLDLKNNIRYRFPLHFLFLAPFGTYTIIYTVQSFFDTSGLINATFDRLTNHLIPFGIVLVAFMTSSILPESRIRVK